MAGFEIVASGFRHDAELNYASVEHGLVGTGSHSLREPDIELLGSLPAHQLNLLAWATIVSRPFVTLKHAADGAIDIEYMRRHLSEYPSEQLYGHSEPAKEVYVVRAFKDSRPEFTTFDAIAEAGELPPYVHGWLSQVVTLGEATQLGAAKPLLDFLPQTIAG